MSDDDLVISGGPSVAISGEPEVVIRRGGPTRTTFELAQEVCAEDQSDICQMFRAQDFRKASNHCRQIELMHQGITHNEAERMIDEPTLRVCQYLDDRLSDYWGALTEVCLENFNQGKCELYKGMVSEYDVLPLRILEVPESMVCPETHRYDQVSQMCVLNIDSSFPSRAGASQPQPENGQCPQGFLHAPAIPARCVPIPVVPRVQAHAQNILTEVQERAVRDHQPYVPTQGQCVDGYTLGQSRQTTMGSGRLRTTVTLPAMCEPIPK